MVNENEISLFVEHEAIRGCKHGYYIVNVVFSLISHLISNNLRGRREMLGYQIQNNAILVLLGEILGQISTFTSPRSHIFNKLANSVNNLYDVSIRKTLRIFINK